MPRNKTTGVTQPFGVRCDMAIPANRGCRSQCRPVVASVAAKVSSASNRAWLGNGCRTAARLRVGPPPRPCRSARHSLGHRLAFASGAGPAMGMVAGPEAPAYRKTSYEAASAFAGEPEVYRGAFVRLIVKSSASLASRWKLPPGKGRAEWASTLPILDGLHRRRTAAVWEIPGTRYRPRRRRAGIRGFP
jgi:hypothetical protein